MALTKYGQYNENSCGAASLLVGAVSLDCEWKSTAQGGFADKAAEVIKDQEEALYLNYTSNNKNMLERAESRSLPSGIDSGAGILNLKLAKCKILSTLTSEMLTGMIQTVDGSSNYGDESVAVGAGNIDRSWDGKMDTIAVGEGQFALVLNDDGSHWIVIDGSKYMNPGDGGSEGDISDLPDTYSVAMIYGKV